MDAGLNNNGVADSDMLENKSNGIVFQLDSLGRKNLGAAFGHSNIINYKSGDEISLDCTELKFAVYDSQGFV
jgi:hypothetical protein